MSKFKNGDKVRYINTDHDTNPNYYPPYGTIGVFKGNNWVQWPDGTTSGDGYWCCDESDIELVVDEKKTIDTHMTNEEIWEMLKPKMEKNGLEQYGATFPAVASVNGNAEWTTYSIYFKEAVHNAIAIAYRSGYERAMKGRPFKIGEKKKKGGHWEPVDPNNLPKEGTRVRYARECRSYKNCSDKIALGSTGVVRLEGPEHNWFGMSLDDYEEMYYSWISFDGLTAKSLDMWVEDDE